MSSSFPKLRSSLASVLALAVIASSAPTFAAEAPPAVSLKSVVKTDAGYDLQVVNRPDEPGDLRIYDGETALSNPVTYLTGGVVRLRDVSKAWTSLSVERSGNKTAEDGTRSRVVESRSSQISVAAPEKTYLKNGARREILRDVAVYAIPVRFAKDLNELSFSGAEKTDGALRTKYSVSIGNGPNLPLEISASAPLEAQKAYLLNGNVVLREQTLPNEYNRVTLKADGVPLNFVTVRKEAEILGALLETSVLTENGENQVVLRFQNSRDIKDLSLFEFTVNEQTTVPEIGLGTGAKSTVSMGFGVSGPITLRIRPSLLGVGETSARIVAKEKSSSLYDSRTVDLSSSLLPLITLVQATPSGAATNFRIDVNPVSLYGDYEKLEIVVNGTGYTARGVKTTLKNADGTAKTDIYGNEQYEFRDRLDFRKTNAGIEFPFPSGLLKKEGNTVRIRNANSGRESDTVTFSPGVAAGPESISGSTFEETVKFSTGSASPVLYDPSSPSAREITLGSLNLSGLDPSAYYKLSAKLIVSSPFNPFSNANAGSPRVTVSGDGDGTAFEITEERLGSSITQNVSFSVAPNVFYASDAPIAFEWKSVKLEKTGGEGWKTVATATAPKGSIVHKVRWGPCSDGNAEVCGKNGLQEESSGSLSLVFGAVPATAETKPATQETPAKTGKKNDPWKISATAGSGPLGKLVEAKLVAAFAKTKDKHSSDAAKRAKLLAAKKAVENALKSVKKYEEAKTKDLRNLLKKALVKDLKEAIKKLAEAGK